MSDFPSGYFFIRNVESGKVLDVYDDGKEVCLDLLNHNLIPFINHKNICKSQPGTKVILFPRKPAGFDNQLWKYHSGFLINKNAGLVLEVPGYGEKLVLYCLLRHKTKHYISLTEHGGKIEPGTCLVVDEQRVAPKIRNQLWAYNHQTLMPYDPNVRVAGSEDGDAVVNTYIHADVRQQWMFDTP